MTEERSEYQPDFKSNTSLSEPEVAWDHQRIKAMFAGTGVFVLLYIFIAITGAAASAFLFLFMPLASSMTVACLVSKREQVLSTCFLSLVVNLAASFFILGEGIFCAAMAFPIFAAATYVTGTWIRDARFGWEAPKHGIRGSNNIKLLILVGVLGYTAYDAAVLAIGAPNQTVSTIVELNASPEEVWHKLSFKGRPSIPVSLWLRHWIPLPQQYDFSAEGIGAQRIIDFGQKQAGDDDDTPRGRITFEVTQWEVGRSCAFMCRSNPTKIGQWVELGDTRVELRPQGRPGSGSVSTQMTLTTTYRRKLGPATYFTPFMNAGISSMHEVLIGEMKEKR